MAVTKTFTVWCDGIDIDGCARWEYATEGTRTITDARHDVRERHGWRTARTEDGRLVDLCDRCGLTDSRPAARPDVVISMSLDDVVSGGAA